MTQTVKQHEGYGCMRVFVYIRYVWASSPYIRVFKWPHIRGDMRNKCPNIRVLQGPRLLYTGARMRVYAGLANHVVYASTRNAFCMAIRV